MEIVVEFFIELVLELVISFGGEALFGKVRTGTVLFLGVGALFGFASLQVFPDLMLHSQTYRLANLAISPFLVGTALGVRGNLSAAEEFDWKGFAHGFALSLGYGVTRFAFA